MVPDFLGGGVDPYNAVPIGAPPVQAFGDPDGSGFQVPCPTPDSLTVNYDAARRLLSRNTVKNDAQCVVKDGPKSDGAWSYDAENRTRTGPNASEPNAWGPDGLLYAHGVISAHYDGGTILFTTYNGALANIKVPGLGYLNFYGSGRGFTVTDRDMSDHLVSKHSAAGYDGLGLVAGSWRTRCGQGLAIESGGGGPTGCSTSAVLGAYIYPSAYQSSTPGTQSIEVLPYVQPDGFDLFGTTIQGVRATDQAAGTWTTPDAYAGDIHDPMSQKPFMWNRNNPYQYQDPSGYKWTYIDPSLKGALAQAMASKTFSARFEVIAKDPRSFTLATRVTTSMKNDATIVGVTGLHITDGKDGPVKLVGTTSISIRPGQSRNATVSDLAHEIAGHAYDGIKNPVRESSNAPYWSDPSEKYSYRSEYVVDGEIGLKSTFDQIHKGTPAIGLGHEIK